MSMMPAQGEVKPSPDLAAHLESTDDLPAELNTPKARFRKMQIAKRASAELAFESMMRVASQGDDTSFKDVMTRLHSAGDLLAEPSGTPSRFERTNTCHSTAPPRLEQNRPGSFKSQFTRTVNKSVRKASVSVLRAVGLLPGLPQRVEAPAWDYSV